MSLAILSVYQYGGAQELHQANWFFSSLMRVVEEENVQIAEVVYGQPRIVSPEVTRFSPQNYISQKLRVYNELVRGLPAEFDKVLLVDPCLFFLSHDWAKRASECLDQHQVVIPFSQEIVVHEPKKIDFGDDRAFVNIETGRCTFRPSLAYAMSSHASRCRAECHKRLVGTAVPERRGYYPNGHVGMLLRGRNVSSTFAWGFRREILDRFGLYDRILVQHDLLAFNMLASALYADFGAIGADFETSAEVCSEEYLAPYFNWAMPLGDYLAQDIGYADNVAMRINIRQPAPFSFRMEGFDPVADLEVADGLLRWKTEGTSQTDIERYNVRHWNYLNAIKV